MDSLYYRTFDITKFDFIEPDSIRDSEYDSADEENSDSSEEEEKTWDKLEPIQYHKDKVWALDDTNSEKPVNYNNQLVMRANKKKRRQSREAALRKRRTRSKSVSAAR